jgi:hypothetical protein
MTNTIFLDARSLHRQSPNRKQTTSGSTSSTFVQKQIQHRISELQKNPSSADGANTREEFNEGGGEEDGGYVSEESGSAHSGEKETSQGGEGGADTGEEFIEGEGEEEGGGSGSEGGGSGSEGGSITGESSRGSKGGEDEVGSDEEFGRPVKKFKRSSVSGNDNASVCTPNRHSSIHGRSPHNKDTSRNSTPTADITPTWGRKRGERRPRKKGMHVKLYAFQIICSLLFNTCTGFTSTGRAKWSTGFNLTEGSTGTQVFALISLRRT